MILRQKRHIFWGAFLLLAVLFSATNSIASPRKTCETPYAALTTAEKIFTEQYARFSGITKEDNAKFIQLEEKISAGEKTPVKATLVAENAVTKELNDTVVERKDEVTALMNKFKTDLYAALKARLPKYFVATYSDFKSVRIDLNEYSPAIQKEVDAIFKTINKRYEQDIKALFPVDQWEKKSRGLAANIKTWHVAVIGETPDEGEIAVRVARSVEPSTEGIPVHTFQELLPKIEFFRGQVEQLQEIVTHHFSQVPDVLTKTSGGHILSEEAIELVKKVSPPEATLDSYRDTLKKDFALRFRHTISDEQAVFLRNYVANAERFSLSPLFSERVVIDMGLAEHGVMSADFRGQNAKNIFETMTTLAAHKDMNVKSFIQELRQAEKRATAALDKKKENYDKALKISAGKKLGRRDFSGDDGMHFPSAELDRADKEKILSHLAKDAESDYRITFLPKQYRNGEIIPKEERAKLIGQAEQIEKDLRKKWITFLPRERLNKLMIAVDYFPQADGTVTSRLYLVGEAARSLSVQEIQKLKALAVDQGLDISEITIVR